MIRINQVKMDISHTPDALRKKIVRLLKITPEKLLDIQIVRKSIDARDKKAIMYVYTLDAKVDNEAKVAQAVDNKNIMLAKDEEYQFPVSGTGKMTARPVICGSGPAGLFAAYFLAIGGYRPILIEQGESVEDRVRTVADFWQTNVLNPDSNVQFGEGGAGTFSDGKLNTLVKDKFGRNRLVLQTFVDNGAKEDILYLNKPHIGTDILCRIVRNMREQIKKNGGEVRFNTKLTDLVVEGGHLQEIVLNRLEELPCENLILAIGHSARETFRMLHRRGLEMHSKAFAVGVRIEHPQEMISRTQYGDSFHKLPPAEYKVTARTSGGRAVYSFCMCPGGYVVNSSSEQNRLVVNGMSNSTRNSANANSAIIVSVDQKDFPDASPLAGIQFVEELEANAYRTGLGKIPVQLLEDFYQGKVSEDFQDVKPCIKGMTNMADINEIFPDYITDALKEGIRSFASSIKGFDRGDAILSAVESRTSSPVRITRSENLQGSIQGIYPCGEGAGYAGGITSAAMDGIRVFEAIASRYRPYAKNE
ncbi:NAD(P)/FAD-dependent oxidoreductase [Parasporobacterium paucivorans]|uniref:FAD-dependent protein C-terminal domain-containing protein n=1 Tax=Parasporobacterium paucivorans DSM 15970 TaxID=1122934 RepID=A0A1M6A215_9FIRM|nr:FAD-dependent oxidoreductase [Parasporobacterium paucivorans]SHI30359.1 hypothetical protein SAMN02745691_00029 [Parasporobacterium paucivorans DSM 15970]